MNSLGRIFMIRRGLPVVLALLVLCSICMPCAAGQEQKEHEWGYSGKEGPANWGDVKPGFATCKTGQHQSPIDIRGAKSSELPAIQFDYKPAALRIINNGHTVQINYAPGSFITIGEKRYELKQFHFHHPSEEKINGKNFPMVAHLVHSDADGNLAVVAVLLKEGAANPLIETLWGLAPKTAGPEKTGDNLQINVADLLPSSRGYYTFTGSLTTPPCAEGVSWFVLKTPTTISSKQLATFGGIYAHNARPTQSLNGRTVLESK